MASALSQYSPFFTSGLLTSASYPRDSGKPARRKFPFSIDTVRANIYRNSRAPRSAIDLSHKDRLQSGYSFLTLDATAPSTPCRKDEPRSSHAKLGSSSRHTLTSQRSVPNLQRGARGVTELPSPKPAPVSSLPDVPRGLVHRPADRVHRPIETQSVASRDETRFQTTTPKATSYRTLMNDTPSVDEYRSHLHISPPPTPGLTPSRSTPRASSPLSPLSPSSSVIAHNRSAALETLEGRRSSQESKRSLTRSANFMSMSDDEEDILDLRSHFEDDSDDEDDEDFFSLPDLSAFPAVSFSWPTSPTSPQCAKRDTYAPFYTSFMDLGDSVANRQ